jgi:MFS transporter, ACS family, glucarate transporter
VWLAIARDTPEEHARVSPAELEKIRSGLTMGAAQLETGERNLIAWTVILASRQVWAVTISYFCYGYVAWIFFGWFYIYLARVRGLDLKSSAFYAMLPFLAMAVGCPIGGVISDWLTKWRGKRLGRCGIAVFSMALAAAFIGLGAHAADARGASVILAGGAGALYLAQSSFWSVTADISGMSSGSVSGVMNMGAQIGGAVAVSLTPWIAAKYGWTASFLLAAALCALGAAAWLLVDPERHLPQAVLGTALRTEAG